MRSRTLCLAGTNASEEAARKAGYLSATSPEMMATAMDAGLFFVDESSIPSDAHRGAGWGSLGETPMIRYRLSRRSP